MSRLEWSVNATLELQDRKEVRTVAAVVASRKCRHHIHASILQNPNLDAICLVTPCPLSNDDLVRRGARRFCRSRSIDKVGHPG